MIAAKSRRIRLGELLVKAGVISEQQLQRALNEQKKWGGKLGDLLVELRLLDEDTLVKALSRQMGLPWVDVGQLSVTPDVLKKIDVGFAEKNRVLTICYDAKKNELTVAMSDPADLDLVDQLGFKTGCNIKVVVAGHKAIHLAIRRLYYGDVNARDFLFRPASTPDVIEAYGFSLRPDVAKEPDRGHSLAQVCERMVQLEVQQRNTFKMLQVIIDILIEKGIVSPEEYRRKIEQ